MDGQVETYTGRAINNDGRQVYKRIRVQIQSPRVPTRAEPKRGQNRCYEQHYKYTSLGNLITKVPYE